MSVQPSSDEIFEWVKFQTELGPRRPGSPAGLANENFLFQKLQQFGLSEVRREAVPVHHWEPDQYACTVSSKSFPVFPIPYSAFTPAEGITAPLIYAHPDVSSSRSEWSGKIVVTEIHFPDLDPALLLKLALGKFDPEAGLASVSHPATWVRIGWHLYHWAFQAGAVGFLGILRDQPGGSCRMYAPYGFKEKNILNKPLPGGWIRRDDGDSLIALAKEGAVACFTSTGTLTPVQSHNIIGEIPGETDETLILSSHHDSPFTSPVEDASGVAVVLALARELAKEKRLRRRIIVLFTSGHFYGSVGTRTFIGRYRSLLPKIAMEISIEHIALEAQQDSSGALAPTGRPEPVGMFIPFNRRVKNLLVKSLSTYHHGSTLLLPPEGPLGEYPPTDGGDWYEAGVPVINYISNPVYLLTDDDAIGWVNRKRLGPVCSLFFDIITKLDAVPLADLRRKNFPFHRLAMKFLKHLFKAKSTSFGRKPMH